MTTTEISLESLRQHVGRRQTATDVIAAGPANLLRLAFGRPEPELRDGDPLPPGWQCLYFLPRFRPEELHPDGSPIDTGVVPRMPLPRRMFAGEDLCFHRPLRIGDRVRRETELADIAVKAGGTGTLVFATVVNRVFGPDGLALEERAADRLPRGGQDRAGEPGAAPGRRRPATSPGGAGSSPIPSSCSGSPRSPSTATASTTTAAGPWRWRVIRGSWCTGRSPPRS